MSYRELRNLTEMMRTLGYPRLISMENFRKPNFPLVAEIIVWLAERFDPDANLSLPIETEKERVAFIHAVVQFMARKGIKLHPKKLYQSDGYAVKEILKIAVVPYNAMKMTTTLLDNEISELPTFDINAKLAELKIARNIGTLIIHTGASLYDLLNDEIHSREKRNLVLERHLDVAGMEKAIEGSLRSVHEEIKTLIKRIDNVSADEATLEAKIEKKRIELERNHKRLAALKNIKPAYMEEFEKAEEELKHVYSQYIIKFRCMTYLEQLEEEYEFMMKQNGKIEIVKANLEQEDQEKSDEGSVASGHESSDFVLEDESPVSNEENLWSSSDGEEEDQSKQVPQPNLYKRRLQPQRSIVVNNFQTVPLNRVFGSMMGEEEDDDDDKSESSNSESNSDEFQGKIKNYFNSDSEDEL